MEETNPTSVESAITSKPKRVSPRRSKDVLSQAEIRRLGPMAHVVMRRILNSALRTKDMKLAARMFDSVAPFLLRRQPIELEHSGDVNVHIDYSRLSLDDLAKLREHPELAETLISSN
jgi:hypothetical protein